MKPLKSLEAGSIGPASPSRGGGGGASSTSAERNDSRPKFDSADAEEDRRSAAPARYCLEIEARAGGLRAGARLPGARRGAPRRAAPPGAGRRRCDTDDRRAPFAAGTLVEQHLLLLQVVDAAEAVAGADRPVHRHGGHAEHALDLVQQFQRIARRQVELVDEGEHRQVALPRHLEQLARLALDALRRVDHHDHRCRRRAVSGRCPR